MALIQCGQCSGRVSEDAWRCPNCGGKLRSSGRQAIAAMLIVVFLAAGLLGGVLMWNHPWTLQKYNGGYPWAFDKFGSHKEMERQARFYSDRFTRSYGTYYRRSIGGYKAAHRYVAVPEGGEESGVYVIKADLDKNFKIIQLYRPVPDRERAADDPYTDL